MSVPSPTELRATLIGEVETLPIVFHPRCNWRVAVSGRAADRVVVDKAIELLGDASPYVSSGNGSGA